jgi:aryl-alcohol dehydrogenase-like predicted oxidoreductase
LILGTANFGQEYGATNQRGELPCDEIKVILERCLEAGINHLDTAQAYGRAEEKLGTIGLRGFSITTKIALQPGENPGLLQEKIRRSLDRLQVNRIENLMLHNEERMTGSADAGAVASALVEIRSRGLAKRVGLSSYDPLSAIRLCVKYNLNVVQMPVHIFDRRLFEGNLLQRFLAAGVEVQARSVFLQGTLLKTPRFGLPVPKRVLDESCLFRSQCQAQGISPLGAALAHLLAAPSALKIVIGVTGCDELEEIIQALSDARFPENYCPPAWRPEFDPRTWQP